MNQEMQTKNESLSTKYEPLKKHRFLLIFGSKEEPLIDSYLVKGIVQNPTYKKKIFSRNPQILKTEGDLVVDFHYPVAPSTLQQVFEICNKNKKISIIEKSLDSVGTVVSHKEYKNCKIKNIKVSESHYECSSENCLAKVTVAFSCKEVFLLY